MDKNKEKYCVWSLFERSWSLFRSDQKVICEIKHKENPLDNVELFVFWLFIQL